jgi:chromosome segregation ATPase
LVGLKQRHNISPPNMSGPLILTLSSKLDEVIESVNSLKESVNVINESNKKLSHDLQDKSSKDRTTGEEMGQLKVTMIRVDENLSLVSTKQKVHEKSIQQLTILVHGLVLPILDDLFNWSLSMNKENSVDLLISRSETDWVGAKHKCPMP